MFKIICVLTAVLVIPSGLAMVSAPAFVFGQFGMSLDAVAAGVARGYGATALGYGLVFLLLRNTAHAEVMRSMLIGSVVFNGLEVVVQMPLAVQGLASAMIWTTILGHAVIGVLSAMLLLQRPSA